MSKLRKNNEKDKVSVKAVKRGGSCPQNPAFSFACLTSNKGYNHNYFKDNNDRYTAIANIYERLLEICEKNWMYWHSLSKQQGLETISAGEINFAPSNRSLKPDEKVIVFRVKGYAGKGARILGVREDGCPILHIIGYDFDFSAYNHG